jgi:hypothetical protein
MVPTITTGTAQKTSKERIRNGAADFRVAVVVSGDRRCRVALRRENKRWKGNPRENGHGKIKNSR